VRKQKGFTLNELLIVLVFLSLIAFGIKQYIH
jgi:prepilin-type N-terminal cleavage/methylation domain-containing protein